jgi:hypothetical protein
LRLSFRYFRRERLHVFVEKSPARGGAGGPARETAVGLRGAAVRPIKTGGPINVLITGECRKGCRYLRCDSYANHSEALLIIPFLMGALSVFLAGEAAAPKNPDRPRRRRIKAIQKPKNDAAVTVYSTGISEASSLQSDTDLSQLWKFFFCDKLCVCLFLSWQVLLDAGIFRCR